MPTVFEARYHGTCVTCSCPIVPGEFAYFTGEDEVAHAECPPPPPEEDPAKACPDCWLIHPDGVKECE